jgi:hypothetical protein
MQSYYSQRESAPQMAASLESSRSTCLTVQGLNTEQFADLPTMYTISSDDLGWIDFSVSPSDRLANARDAFFESIASPVEFAKAIDQPRDDEQMVLDELEELIEVMQTTIYNSALESPLHPTHSPYKTVQTPQTSH